MAVTAKEYFRSRRGDAYSSRERDYIVTDSDGDLDDTAAINAAVAESPATIATTDGSLFRTNANIAREISNGQMVVSVQYGEIGFGGAATMPAGTLEYEFNYQAPSERIYQSLETKSITIAGGTWPTDRFGGAIGVLLNNDGTHDIEGVETSPGNTTNTWSFTAPAVTSAYEAMVEGMCGAVNNAPFKGRPAGTMRLVSVQSNASFTSKAQIRFGMQFSPNVTNIPVGNITVPSKDGHDYLWVYRDLREQVIDNGKKLLLPYPKAAVVERVFPRANFSLLGF